MQSQTSVNNTTTESTTAEIIPHPRAVEFLESTANFLSSILPSGRTGEARLEYGEREREPAAVADIEDLGAFLAGAARSQVYVHPVTTENEAAFAFKFIEDATPGEDTTFHLRPTVTLNEGARMICIWAFANPVSAEAAAPLFAALESELDEAIPIPGAAWKLAACDAGIRYDLADLEAAFGVEPASQGSPKSTFRDAAVITPFDPKDPRLDREVTLSGAGSATAKRWRRNRLPLRSVLELFATHRQADQKDGPAVVLGALSGPQRTATAVRRLDLVGLDLDSGFPGDELLRRVAASGLTAVIATTHSHMKSETREPLDVFVTWARKEGLGDEVTDEVARARLQAKGLLPEIAAEATATVETGPTGREVIFQHPPIPKWRVIVPLASPFLIADHGATDREGLEAWRRVPQALADLLGLPIDKTGCDPNRLFYLPTHAPGRPFEAYVFGGDFFDADAALAGAPVVVEQPRGRGESAPGAIDKRWAAKRADGFQIADLIRDVAPDRVRGGTGDKLTVECPNDNAHSNSGDTSDAGCFVENAGDVGFRWVCKHNACQGLDRLDLLNMAISDGWFTADDVTGDEYDAVDRSGESAGRAPSPPGGVAVGGVLDGLEEFDPERRVFAGKDACDDAIRELGKVVAVLTQGNKTRIAIRTRNGLVFNSRSDANTRFNSYRVLLETTNAKDEVKVEDLAALNVLLKSEKVRIFDGIDCDPTDRLPAHILNTWEGLAVTPAPGDCSRIIAHIEQVICAGNRDHAKTLLQYFAHMFQRPAQKPGFAPVVIGPKGCGKSTVGEFICRAIGRRHSVKIAQARHLVGNFNSHLAAKLFVLAEEVTFGGDRKNEGTLKDAITAPTMLTEPKGLDAYQEANFSRFFLVTNPSHAVPASDGERRWFVLQARDLFEGKPHDDPARVAYFKALYEEADNGGIEAFVHYLMHLDISDFLPFAAPHTEALVDQVRQSLSDEDAWVLGALRTGQFDTRDGETLGEEWDLATGMEIDRADLQRSFDSHVRRYGGSSGGSGICRTVLERFGTVEKRRRGTGARQNYYVLGPRADWRAAFTTRFGITFGDEDDHASGNR